MIIMSNLLNATELSANRTEYVHDIIITNYDTILEGAGSKRGSHRRGWFGYLDVVPYAARIPDEEVDRELLKLSMQGFLETKLIMDFLFYRKLAKEHPELPIPSGNMYRFNTESRNFEDYTKRREHMGKTGK